MKVRVLPSPARVTPDISLPSMKTLTSCAKLLPLTVTVSPPSTVTTFGVTLAITGTLSSFTSINLTITTSSEERPGSAEFLIGFVTTTDTFVSIYSFGISIPSEPPGIMARILLPDSLPGVPSIILPLSSITNSSMAEFLFLFISTSPNFTMG